ncbi:MAG TPA: HYExAFE family protein [Gemmataceae bacterium]|nr:HYExAFE family protein [Gemmataceae bacterium]
MDRSNHYEAAFEAYLQSHRLGYVGVDETRRSMLGDDRIKSLDFIVHGEKGARLLVDVKGRRFPSGPSHRQRRVWECWSTLEDLSGLERWTEVFGPGYQGLLVFAYHIQSSVIVPIETEDLWSWRGRRYLLRAVPVEEYRRHMRIRSPKWGTVSLPGAVFRALAQPFQDFTHGRQPVAAECPF